MSQATRPGTMAAQRPNRMTLGGVKSSLLASPDRILLVGTEGIGKSTFGACAPSPIFIPTEDGIRHLDVPAFPVPTCYGDVLDAVKTLTNDAHDYKTLVVDTLDALEPMLWDDLCKRNDWANIESPGYGKGFTAATADWRHLLLSFDRLRATKSMEIILIAHSTLRNVTNPSGPDYSRYEGKLNKNAMALVKEWTDVNLFAVHEEFVKKGSGDMKAKVSATGRRVIHTERSAAWDAKNRHNLPPVIALDYAEYAAAREAGRPASAEKLDAEARSLLAAWAPDADAAAKFTARLDALKQDAAGLARAVDFLKTKVAEKESA